MYDRWDRRDLSTIWAKSVRSAQIKRSWKRWHVLRIVSVAPDVYLCQLELGGLARTPLIRFVSVAEKNMVVCAFCVIFAFAQAPRFELTCAMMSACVGADCRGPLVEQSRG